MENADFWTRITSLYGSQNSPVVLCKENNAICTRITSLCGTQPSPVVLSTHNGVLSTRISSLYGFQPSPVVLCMQNSDFRTRVTSLWGSQTLPVVFACKTAWLASEWQVSMGPSPHLWFLHAKQRLLDQNYKSLWVPHLTSRLVHEKHRD